MCLFLSHANGGTRSSDLLQALPRALRIYVTPHHRTTGSLVSEKTSYRQFVNRPCWCDGSGAIALQGIARVCCLLYDENGKGKE
jgi:hypothetical protein